MNWKKIINVRLSSPFIKPKKGMRLKTMQAIDGKSQVIGKKGTILKVSYGCVYVEYDDHVDGHDEANGEDGHVWNGGKDDWNNGAYQILDE